MPNSPFPKGNEKMKSDPEGKELKKIGIQEL